MKPAFKTIVIAITCVSALSPYTMMMLRAQSLPHRTPPTCAYSDAAGCLPAKPKPILRPNIVPTAIKLVTTYPCKLSPNPHNAIPLYLFDVTLKNTGTVGFVPPSIGNGGIPGLVTAEDTHFTNLPNGYAAPGSWNGVQFYPGTPAIAAHAQVTVQVTVAYDPSLVAHIMQYPTHTFRAASLGYYDPNAYVAETLPWNFGPTVVVQTPTNCQ